MKTIFLAFCLCLLSPLLMAAEQPVKSEIKSVTVFLKGAQIVREANFSVNRGSTTLVLNGLPATLNKGSIQVEGKGSFTVLSVSHELDYQEEEENSEKVNFFQAEIEKTRNRIQELEAMLLVYQEEEKLLYENRKLGGSEQGVPVARLIEAADFYRSRLKEIKFQQLETQQQINKLKEEESNFSKSLRESKAQKGQPTSRVLVKIEAAVSGKAQMMVSYLVEQAGWYPSYDLRVKEVGEPLVLQYKAMVHQQSGEDWKQVNLVVSTGNPETNINIPELKPQWVNFQENILWQQDRHISGNSPGQVQGRVVDGDMGDPLPGVTVMVKGTTVGSVTDVNGNYSISIPSGAQFLQFSFIGYMQEEVPIQGRQQIDVSLHPDLQQLEEVVVIGYGSDMQGRAAGVSRSRSRRVKEEASPIAAPDVAQVQNQITTEFIIAQPFTIPSDGKGNMVEVQEHKIPVFYQYFAAPAKEGAAFLTANITEWEQVDLLAGEASLFFEGKYVGKTLIDPLQTQDTLKVSLGKDKNVMVKREEVKDYNTSTFFGGKKIEEHAFTISVRNAKQKPIQLLLRDRVPVSRTSDITVETEKLSGAAHDSKTGILQWTIELQPNSQVEKEISYTLKYSPKRKIVFYEN